MKQRIKILLAVVLLDLALFGVAAAGPLEDGEAAIQRGVEAYRRGDMKAQRDEELLALRLFRPLAEQGDVRAQVDLGGFYRGGQLADPKQSIFWFRKAAEQGDRFAQVSLGQEYYAGEGVAKDYAQAFFWFRKAADQADKDGEFMLGIMYDMGEGVPRNYAQAVAWYRKAVDQGDAFSQDSLGDKYREGRGVPQDYVQAVMWYRKAAEQGDTNAKNSLGEMYEAGQGGPQDYVRAYVWFSLAALPSDPDTPAANKVYAQIYGEKRDQLAAKMTSAQIAQAKKLVSERHATPQPNVAALSPLQLHPSDLPQSQSTALETVESASEIQLERRGGTFLVPVSINGALTLNFTIDSGASDVSIPGDVFLTLMRTGTIRSEDFLGSQTYRLADGSTVPSETFRIRSLKVGDREIENVTASVAKVEGSLLLGQSFLARFRSWSIDNERGLLLLK